MLSGCGGGFGALGCIVSGEAAIGASAFSGGFAGGSLAVMSIAMLLSDRFRRCPFASGAVAVLGRGRRRGRFRRGVARLLDLELIVEHRLAERRRRQQSGHFEQHAVGAAKLGLDEAARIGGGIDEIARCAAARAKSEAIERN